MKKILMGMFALLMSASVAMAQTPAAKQDKTKAEHRSEKPGSKAQRPALDSTSGKPFKKDGTPDKRFKENKAAKDSARGPLKKDGTPDKRFKENKDGKAEGPKKKDGTLDKRFKENKEKKA